MYTFDYSINTDIAAKDAMPFHTGICIIADKYDISSLRKLATDKFAHIATTSDHAEDFINTIELAYAAESATSEIRKALVDRLVDCGHFKLQGDENWILEKVMESSPRFAIETFRAQQAWHKKKKDNLDKMSIYRCGNCDEAFEADIPYYGTDKDKEEFYGCPDCGWEDNLREWIASVIDVRRAS